MMTKTLLRAGALACALTTSTCLTPAYAQTAPPRFQEVDANGVDLISGRFVFEMVEGTIGAGDGAVSLMRSDRNDYGRINQWQGSINQLSGTQMRVQFGARTETFTLSGSTWTPDNADGATLTDSSGSWTYRSADGTTVTFAMPADGYTMGGCAAESLPACMVVASVARPNGTTFTLDWTVGERCMDTDPITFECVTPVVKVRLAGVASSAGYAFSIGYTSVLVDNPGWGRATGATFTNNVTAPPANPTVTYTAVSSGVEDVTDTGGRTWRITTGSYGITGIRRPGSSSDDITVSYNGSGIVTSVTRDGVTANYSRSVSGNTATTTITNALSQQTLVVADLSKSRITSVTDPLNRTTSYSWDSNSRLTRVTMPEGNYVEYTRDARGNVTQTQLVPKPGSGSSTLTASAAYPSSCGNPLTCNSPTSTTDARGHTTDFTWDSTHGGVLTVTAPAPSGSGDRPQTRYAYTLTNGEYRLTGVSACSAGTSPSCVGTADEARTVIGYDSQGLVTSVEQRNGSGTISATTAATYDAYGNLLTVDGPLSGTADTTRFRYNAARQLVGVVGPDPDGGGSLKHRAVRTTYRSDGLPTKVEQGTVNSQSDGDWSSFATLEEVQTDYDSNDRPVVQRLVSGSTIYALTQTSYDTLGRVQCVAQRMNPGEFASLPSDACALDSEGSHGPDRIARTTYDAAGQVTLVETGVGTSAEADEVATAWTSNGQVAHVTDAEGNRTTYEYDGHDRLVKTRFPSPTTDNTSSTTDYEQLTLDANGNVVSRRLRDGTSIGFTFDALNRVTDKDLPGSELDVTYGYDLLGRLTSAATSAQTLSFTFDALGRSLTQTGPHGTVTSAWDVAGRRTSLTYADSGLVVGYSYNLAGEMTEIRENPSGGNVLLGTLAYDDRGRRTSLTRGNGTATTYDYDPVSRLDELVQNLAGTASDLTLEFAFNPAGQIASSVRSNDAFSFTGLANQNVSDTHNGLNQVTATGTTSVTHDSRGNVSVIGSASYGYSSENLLTSAPGGVTLAYDPLMRLYQTAGGSTTRFGYDGLQLIAEYNGSSQLQRRYVFGPGIDEPIVWYEGSGTGDRRWFHADERGSIVAVSDGNGDLVSTRNRYDEYGSVQGTLTGRFGYTGQAWLPEAGLWYYRARMYNPSLGGRFMQADPIGYEGGMNLYAYVGNDPINLTDPAGQSWESGTFEEARLSAGSFLQRDPCIHRELEGCPPNPMDEAWRNAVDWWNRNIYESRFSRWVRGCGAPAAGSGARGAAIGGAVGFARGGYPGAAQGALRGGASGLAQGSQGC